jgi:hypothetical protein
VPAVFVSPYIPRATIIGSPAPSLVFDHTSLIATARKLFIPNYQNFWLTQRDKNANTFERVLTLTNPRTDSPFAQPHLSAPGAAKKVFAAAALTKPQAAKKKAQPLSQFRLAALLQAQTLESTLPPEERSGINISSIKTEQDLAVYLAEVQKKLEGRKIDLSKLGL